VIEAVIFDWGGTLTPWKTVDAREVCRWTCSPTAGSGVSRTFRS
jgi:hypothetical protein